MEKERKCKNKTCAYFSKEHEFNCCGELYNGECAIEVCEFWEVDDEEKKI
jgi:hypothetical protein